MKYFSFAFIFGVCVFLYACSKNEEKLNSSGIDEYGYLLPQGNHDYDQRILEYYNRFGTYFLYQFSQQDINWAVTGTNTSYTSLPSDTNYINKQLDLIDTTFLRYYPDSTLKKVLPMKLFLCRSLLYGGKEVDSYVLTSTVLGGIQSFAVNWGSSRILNITKGTATDSVALFRSNINYSLWKMADLNGIVPKSTDFLTLSDYSTSLPTAANGGSIASRYNRGFLSTSNTTTSYSTTLPSSQTDYYLFLQVIMGYNYSYLSNSTSITSKDGSYKGILTSVKDSSGLIRRKYNAIVNYYKNNYNVDLQRIGDGAQ